MQADIQLLLPSERSNLSLKALRMGRFEDRDTGKVCKIRELSCCTLYVPKCRYTSADTQQIHGLKALSSESRSRGAFEVWITRQESDDCSWSLQEERIRTHSWRHFQRQKDISQVWLLLHWICPTASNSLQCRSVTHDGKSSFRRTGQVPRYPSFTARLKTLSTKSGSHEIWQS